MRKLLSEHMASIFVVTALIALVSASRLIAHAPNMTLIFGVSLFSGFNFQKNKFVAVFIPLTSLFLSDCILGFHAYMWGTYLGTLIAISSGLAACSLTASRNSLFPKLIGLSSASVVSSSVFYFISNFHVWTGSGSDSMYPKTFSGLIACYVAALPFLKNSLTADMATVTLLFIGTQAIQKFKFTSNSLFGTSTKIA